MREELERARYEDFCKSYVPLTREELEAMVNRENTIEEIIADLKKELGMRNDRIPRAHTGLTSWRVSKDRSRNLGRSQDRLGNLASWWRYWKREFVA